MSFFEGGISNAGRLAILTAANGALELGGAQVGSLSVSAGAVINANTVEAAGEVTNFAPDEVFYMVMGSNRITLFVEMEMPEAKQIGNILFFLSDGTPLAWGRFEYAIRKAPKEPDSAGDWVVLALSLVLDDILEKFTLDPNQSNLFEVAKTHSQETAYVEFSAYRKIVTIAKNTIGNFDHPSVLFKSKKWNINPFFVPVDSEFGDMTGGEVGDGYDRSL